MRSMARATSLSSTQELKRHDASSPLSPRDHQSPPPHPTRLACLPQRRSPERSISLGDPEGSQLPLPLWRHPSISFSQHPIPLTVTPSSISIRSVVWRMLGSLYNFLFNLFSLRRLWGMTIAVSSSLSLISFAMFWIDPTMASVRSVSNLWSLRRIRRTKPFPQSLPTPPH